MITYQFILSQYKKELKVQVPNKFQISMTKAFTVVVSHRFANPVLPVRIQLGTTVNGLFVWNFEFGSLGFV